MELLSRYLTSEIEEFNRNNVQVRFMGSREGLPEVVKRKWTTLWKQLKQYRYYFKLGNKLRWAGRNFTGNTAYCGRYRKRLAESRRYTGRNF